MDASRLLAMLAAFFSAPVCTDVDVLVSGKQFAVVGTVQIGMLCDNHGLPGARGRWGALGRAAGGAVPSTRQVWDLAVSSDFRSEYQCT